MSLLLAWVLFPAVLAVLAMGCGLALEWLAGARLPSCLVAPAGLALIIVITQFATATSVTAPLATPAVIVVAAAGVALETARQQLRRFARPELAAAVAVFGVFGAPVLLSGHATFAGFVKLDDISTFLALTDRVMEHGRSLAGLAPSSYETTLSMNLGIGYPVGSLLPLGVGAQLLNQDPAWLFQPWLAFLAGMLALALNGLLMRAIPGARLRAVCVFIAAQPALLFGYAQWGGVKELATAWVVALMVALVPVTVRHAPRMRRAFPLATAGAATLAIVSAAGVVWALPAAACAVAAAIWRHGRRAAFRVVIGLAVTSAALAVPSIVVAARFLGGLPDSSSGPFRSQNELGMLFRPLNPLQVVGIWPAGDFRIQPSALDATHLLIGAVGIAAVVGVVVAVSRRAWELLIYACGIPAVALATLHFTSPWIGGKALAIASPGLLLLACAGCAAAWSRHRRFEAGVVAAAIAGGVLWSNAFAYHVVTLAPRGQLADLERIGQLAAGEGPTLMTEYNPYGARHFLRDADAEGATELRRRTILLRTGQIGAPGTSPDVDEVQLDALLVYRTLVLRRSPVASRPPAMYHLVWRGRTYEMWQRPVHFTAPLEHFSLGNALSPAAQPDCEQVVRLGRRAGAQGVLATVFRPVPVVIAIGALPIPSSWQRQPGDPTYVFPRSSGRVSTQIDIDNNGLFDLWLAGVVYGQVTVSIDGNVVGVERQVFTERGGYSLLGKVRLARGRHRILLDYHSGGIRPGSGGARIQPLPMGPLVLSRTPDPRVVRYVPASRARALCGRELDWIEALRRRG